MAVSTKEQKFLSKFVDNFNDNIARKLFTKPLKPYTHYDRPENNPENLIQEADLLELPKTPDGYRYLLTVIDEATRKFDGEPLKQKTATETKSAFEKIYARGIIKFPKILKVDRGKEFNNGLLKTYMKNNGSVLKVIERPQQLPYLGFLHSLLGRAIFIYLVNEEYKVGHLVTNWIPLFAGNRPLIKSYNEEYTRPAKPGKYKIDPFVCKGKDCKILDKGQKVMMKLKKPVENLTGKELSGNFRSSDVRWDSKNIKTITGILLIPGNPPLYRVNGNDKVWFSGRELLPV